MYSVLSQQAIVGRRESSCVERDNGDAQAAGQPPKQAFPEAFGGVLRIPGAQRCTDTGPPARQSGQTKGAKIY
jgi:hypothetical protein